MIIERKEYLEKRQSMLNEAKQLINSGKIDEGNKKMEEIKALDERFEAEAKAYGACAAGNGPAESHRCRSRGQNGRGNRTGD